MINLKAPHPGTFLLAKNKLLEGENMAKEFAKRFYNSEKWKRCRAAYIKLRQGIDGGLCETCHEEPGYIVHHRIELTPENINDPEIALDFHNLKFDCHNCHNKEGHGKGNIPGLADYIITEDGEVIQAPP